MYILPNSTLKILKGIRLNENYTDTAFFETKSDQLAYFNSKVAYTLTEQYYVRKTVGQLKVKLTIGQLTGASYMMFKNTSFEDKWFFAFITNYEYVNNETSLVYFEIDLLQTYMFDYTTKPCMVERMHTIDDTLGKNRVPEGLDTGEYVYNEQPDNRLLWNDWSICIFHTLNNDGNAVSTIDGDIMGGLYSGLNMKVCSTPAQANTFLTNVSSCALEGAVVAVVMLPTYYVTKISGEYPDTYTYSGISLPTSYGGYTPHNNKCYLSPFRGIYVTNGQGTVASFNIEDFADPTDPEFMIKFSLGAVSDCMLQPIDYRHEARQFGVELSGFPQCAYTTDGYKSWLARNAGFLALAQTNLEQQNNFQNNALAMQQQGLTIGNENANALYGLNKENILAQQSIGSNQLKFNTGMNAVTGLFGTAQSAVAGGIVGAAAGPAGAIGGAIAGSVGGIAGIAQGLGNAVYQQQAIDQSAQNALSVAQQGNQYANQMYQLSTAQIANQKAAINAANAIAVKQLYMQKHVASLTPPSFHGQSVGSATKLFGDFGYHIGTFSSRAQFVRKADDFFDLYGYAQNELLNPYRKARKHWTYVKTRGANFRDISNPQSSTGVPADDMAAINNLYDGGIRFWTDPDKIGNYTSHVDPNDPSSPTYQEDNTILANPIH